MLKGRVVETSELSIFHSFNDAFSGSFPISSHAYTRTPSSIPLRHHIR